MALDEHASILQKVQHAWAGLGAAFGPTILISLFWSKMTRNGALAGIISGAVLVLLWHWLKQQYAGYFNLYELLPGFIASTICIIAVSKADKLSDAIVLQHDKFLQQYFKNE